MIVMQYVLSNIKNAKESKSIVNGVKTDTRFAYPA